LQDNAYVVGMQRDLDGDKCNHSEALQVPTATSRCATQESEGTQQQDTFACVKVEVSCHCQKLYLKMEVLFTKPEWHCAVLFTKTELHHTALLFMCVCVC
jgi:hypothetical protein